MEIVIPGVTRKLALKHHFIPRLYVSADLPIPEWKEIQSYVAGNDLAGY